MRTVYRYPYFMGGRANGRRVPETDLRTFVTAHLQRLQIFDTDTTVPDLESAGMNQVIYELRPLIRVGDTEVEAFVATERLDSEVAAERALGWLCKRAGLKPEYQG